MRWSWIWNERALRNLTPKMSRLAVGDLAFAMRERDLSVARWGSFESEARAIVALNRACGQKLAQNNSGNHHH